MNTNPPATTYEGQLAVRVDELLPGLDTDARLELLGAMDADDLRSSLAFIASMYPQAFDFALVRDRAMAARLNNRPGEDQAKADVAMEHGGGLPSLLAAGRQVTYTPDPVWDGWFADVRDGDRLIECGFGFTQHEARAHLAGRLDRRGGLGGLLGAVLDDGLSARFARDADDGACLADLISTTGSQASGIGRTPLGALQAAAAEYGIDGGIARSEDDEDQADDEDGLEPYCKTCGERIGCFIGYEGWHHFRGDGTPENRTELYDAGHVPAVAWRATGEENQ